MLDLTLNVYTTKTGAMVSLSRNSDRKELESVHTHTDLSAALLDAIGQLKREHRRTLKTPPKQRIAALEATVGELTRRIETLEAERQPPTLQLSTNAET